MAYTNYTDANGFNWMQLQLNQPYSITEYDWVVVQCGANLGRVEVRTLLDKVGPMQGRAISSLPIASYIDGTEYMLIVQDGITKRISVDDLLGGPRAMAARSPALPVIKATADQDEAIDNAIQAARAVA